jgi:proteic killer suppression protein
MCSAASASTERQSNGKVGEEGRPLHDRGLDDSNAPRYYRTVIRSFRDKDTARLYHREPIRKLPHTVHRVALRKLVQLDAATTLDDLRVPPGNRLEKLVGRRAGQHSIRINDQWRVCFRWERGDAYDVEIVDYH